jgi:hypothetical protein
MFSYEDHINFSKKDINRPRFSKEDAIEGEGNVHPIARK